MTDLIKSVSFDAWTTAAAGILERIDRIAAIQAEMLALGETINVSRFSLRVYMRAEGQDCDVTAGENGRERIERELRRELWREFAQKSGLLSMLDAQGREEFQKSLGANPAPFDRETVLKTFESIADQRGAIMIRGLLNAVKGIGSWCWKSNQPYKLGKRAVVHIGHWSCSYQTVGKIDDLNRVFAKLDGKPEPESLVDNFRGRWVGTTFVGGEYGSRLPLSPYFDVRRFRNGNAHLIFTRPDLVDEANRLIASRYPQALAPKVAA